MINYNIKNTSLKELQIEEISNFLNNNNNKFDVFNIQENINITIIIFDTKLDFDKEYIKYSNKKVYPWMVGCSGDGIIKVVSYLDYKNTTHKNDTFDEYKKMILHEVVHVVHSYYTNIFNNPYYKVALGEGLASFLSEQYNDCSNLKEITFEQLMDNNNYIDYSYYYSFIRYIFENFSQQEILNILKMDKDITNELQNIYNNIIHI